MCRPFYLIFLDKGVKILYKKVDTHANTYRRPKRHRDEHANKANANFLELPHTTPRLNASSFHTVNYASNEMKTCLDVLYSIWIRFPVSTKS